MKDCCYNSQTYSQSVIYSAVPSFIIVSQDSVVTIATRYRVDGPGIESWWGRVFPHLSSLSPRPTQPPIQWLLGHSMGVIWPGQGVNHSPSSSTRVKERVELYLCSHSVSSLQFIGRILRFLVSLIHVLHMFVLQEETELNWLQRYTYDSFYSGTVEILWCIEVSFFAQVLKSIRVNYDCKQCSPLCSIVLGIVFLVKCARCGFAQDGFCTGLWLGRRYEKWRKRRIWLVTC